MFVHFFIFTYLLHVLGMSFQGFDWDPLFYGTTYFPIAKTGSDNFFVGCFRMHGDLDFLALDAKALLVPQVPGVCFAQENKSLNSTPPSSLDLEWEHEGN